MFEPLESSWQAALRQECDKAYFTQLASTLTALQAQGREIYPPKSLIFNAFHLTPLAQVKVVIIGQDPYHQPQQAMGLSFSVPVGVKIPPSLRTVYRELARSCPEFEMPMHGDLTAWARQGVFLLNAVLTVEAGKPASHARLGWQSFTDAVIQAISRERQGVVFLLWGNFAKQKASLIDAARHVVLTAVHPSPLARGGFIGCQHFVLANEHLRAQGQTPIDWQV